MEELIAPPIEAQDSAHCAVAHNGHHAPKNGEVKVLSPARTQNGHVAAHNRAQNEPYAVDLTTDNTLADDHRAKLKAESGLSDEVIAARGYWTCDGDGATLLQMGFPRNLGRCLIIPRWNHRGYCAGYIARPDIPIRRRDGKAPKYLLPKGATQELDINPLRPEQLSNPNVPLLFTEGAKKADSATAQGLCCINLNGVSGYRGTNDKGGIATIAAFDDIPLTGKRSDGSKFGRVIYIAFDSDVTTNPKVEIALRQLARALSSRGASVKIVQFEPAPDGDKTGLDDFFSRDGGTVESLFSMARDLESIDHVKQRNFVERSLKEVIENDFSLDEIGNGKRFAAQHSADLLFCGVREQWQNHKEGRWQPDEHCVAEQRAKAIGKAIAQEAARENDDNKRALLLKHALTLTKRATREIMLKDAASEPGMMTTPEQFDADPHLFNLANGTLHLQTFEFRPHRAADLLTLQSAIVFDASAQCLTWRACMARWIPDEATRDYMQESVGISLSGKVFEEFFNFIFGGGDNGKSTFIRMIEQLCGTYWHKTQAETIMQARDRRQPNAPAPELLALKGARLVTVHEIDSKHQLNAPLIKDLTGRDSITARGLFEKRPTTFEPQFTLWMFGNGKPQIKDTSGGMWRRVRLIDFGQPIPPNERDPQLSEKLSAELPGILNWALEGLRRVYERGLIVPDAVKAATDEYRAEQDPMTAFIQDCCVIKTHCEAGATALFEAWCAWCRANGEREGSQRALGLELKRRKFEKVFGRDGVKWRGIGLKASDNGPKLPQNGDSVNLVNLVNDIPEKLHMEDSYAKALSEKGSQGSQGSQNRPNDRIFKGEPAQTSIGYGND